MRIEWKSERLGVARYPADFKLLGEGEPAGSFEAYVAIFGTPDRPDLFGDSDIVAPGAFTQTLQEKGLPPVVWTIPPVGQALQAVEDGKGPRIQGLLEPPLRAALLVVELVWGNIQTTIQTAVGVIEGLVDIVAGLLTGDWSRAWGGAQQVVESVFEGVKAAVANAVTFIDGLAPLMLAAASALPTAAGRAPGRPGPRCYLRRRRLACSAPFVRDRPHRPAAPLVSPQDAAPGAPGGRKAGTRRAALRRPRRHPPLREPRQPHPPIAPCNNH